MIRFLLVVLLGVGMLPVVASAYQVIEHIPAEQYEVQSLEGDPQDKRTLIGTLKDAPIMYEILSDHDFTLALDVRAVPTSTPPQFSVIVVRVQQPRGVEEVTRLQQSAATWTQVSDPTSGLPYLAGPSYSEVLPAGTYQIEVSTPNNKGQYALVLGNQQSNESYAVSLRSVRTMYDFYSASPLGMVRSPYVYYPLLVLIFFGLVGYGVYRFRHKLPFISPATSHV
jgi:hypothetical protein